MGRHYYNYYYRYRANTRPVSIDGDRRCPRAAAAAVIRSEIANNNIVI